MTLTLKSIIQHLKSFARGYSYAFGSFLVFGSISLLGWLWYASPLPLRILPVNPGSQSYALAFTTMPAVKTCLIVQKTGSFSIDQMVCDRQSTSTHLLSLKNLIPETTYTLTLISRFRFTRKSLPTIKTTAVPETPPLLPEPSYGSVIDEQGSPVENALVIVIPDQDVSRAVAAVTNIQGNFAVDISPFINQSQNLTVDASTITGLWGNQTAPKTYHSPYPTLTVKPLVKL